MDLLKKEMERKKKAMALAKGKTAAGGSRFVKAGDLRRVQEEEEERLRQKRPREQVSNLKTDEEQPDNDENSNDATAPDLKKKRSSNSSSLAKLSSEDLLKRLRGLGLPISLFGESLENRIQRLQTALVQQSSTQKTQTEMDEFRLGKGHGIRNPFLDREKDTKKKVVVVVAAKEEEDEHDPTDDDPHKKVYRFLKGLLNQWEEDLALRPEAAKRTAAGKNETKTLKQCKDYIRPLFKQLKTRKLEEGLLHHVIKIVDCCKEGEFVRAHDAYLDLAIGRSAWPIGVTMVGIHARSGRAKIEAANVAHVMNSELQRKYLTSVKRLMTYAQKKADHVDPSKKVH